MNKFLYLQHWQLFGLIIGLPLLFLISAVLLALNEYTSFAGALLAIALLVFVLLFYTWFYSIGVNLYSKLPDEATMPVKWFRISVVLPILYFLLLSILIIFESTSAFSSGSKNSDFLPIILPLHFLTMVCNFFCLYFISKSLRMVEIRKRVVFNEFIGEFFLIWFFPIGIWFIQPRINKIFGPTIADELAHKP